MLRENGADEVYIDDGAVARQVDRSGRYPNKVLELVGTTTLVDSLHCCRDAGVVCMTGMVGNKWTLDNFDPMDAIPTAVLASMPGRTRTPGDTVRGAGATDRSRLPSRPGRANWSPYDRDQRSAPVWKRTVPVEKIVVLT